MPYTQTKISRVFGIDAIYTAFVASYDEEFYFPGESHDMWEWDCILEGVSGITSGKYIYECGPYESVLHRPLVFHSAWSIQRQGIRVLTVSFTGENLDGVLPGGKFVLTPFERELVNRLAECLMRENGRNSHRPDKGVAPADSQLVAELLEVLFLSFAARKDEQAVPVHDAKASLFAEAVHYLENRVDENPDLDAVCRRLGIGRTSLKELFRNYTGGSVLAYRQSLRLRRAISLLESGLSMAEIANRMNFSSQNYFSSFFKRETGLSPLQYRHTLSRE